MTDTIKRERALGIIQSIERLVALYNEEMDDDNEKKMTYNAIVEARYQWEQVSE